MVGENRVQQLLAKFEPWGDGLVYHHDASTGGLPCTRAEVEQLLADIVMIEARARRSMTAWVILAAIAMVAFSSQGAFALERWQQGLVLLAPLPFALQQTWRAHRLPWERFGRRTPVAPPRPAMASFWTRVAALPGSLALALVAIPSVLAWQVLKDGWLAATDAGYLPAMVIPPAFAAVIVYAKIRRR
jgi:hypothetical protein